ncbi:MAG: hypothetical protein WA755_10365 [Candidatus Acidiferrales bacterium]
MSKQDQRDPIRELLDGIRRELEGISPDDYGKIAELRQALDGVGRKIGVMRESAGSLALAEEKAARRKDLALATWRMSEFPESERPEWAKSSCPPEPTTEANAEIRALTQEVAGLKATIEGLAKAEQVNGRESPTDAGLNLPEKIQHGKRCAQLIDEIRRVRNLVLGTGRTIAEVRGENPTLLVWAIRDALQHQDREIFDHPNRWGPVVGYAHGLLSKEYGRSDMTIRDWVKAFRRQTRQRSTPSH